MAYTSRWSPGKKFWQQSEKRQGSEERCQIGVCVCFVSAVVMGVFTDCGMSVL